LDQRSNQAFLDRTLESWIAGTAQIFNAIRDSLERRRVLRPRGAVAFLNL
jgi:hypothetical protein